MGAKFAKEIEILKLLLLRVLRVLFGLKGFA